MYVSICYKDLAFVTGYWLSQSEIHWAGLAGEQKNLMGRWDSRAQRGSKGCRVSTTDVVEAAAMSGIPVFYREVSDFQGF